MQKRLHQNGTVQNDEEDQKPSTQSTGAGVLNERQTRKTEKPVDQKKRAKSKSQRKRGKSTKKDGGGKVPSEIQTNKASDDPVAAEFSAMKIIGYPASPPTMSSG